MAVRMSSGHLTFSSKPPMVRAPGVSQPTVPETGCQLEAARMGSVRLPRATIRALACEHGSSRMAARQARIPSQGSSDFRALLYGYL